MSNSTHSCLVAKLSHYMELDDASLGYLAALEEQERIVAPEQEIYETGEELSRIFVVKTGWLYSYIDMPDGRRQIVKTFVPGDIIGFPDVALTKAATSLKAAENSCLCPAPKSKLDIIFKESPRLSALLFSLANRDLTIVIDLLQAIGRLNATERMAYLYLDTLSRLRVTNKTMSNTFRLPLNQTEIGDHLGLTHTYVSKTLRKMQKDGLIARQGEIVTVLKEAELRESIEFIDRYSEIDTSWFPDR